MSSSSEDEYARRQRAVEVIMPGPTTEEGAQVSSSIASTAVGSASSASPDVSSIIEKAIAALPPELAEQAKDSKRKAQSQDPGWKYGWWPDPTKKEFIQCIFCRKVVPSGIGRFKMHLAGSYGDALKCPKPNPIVQREMTLYLKKNTRTATEVLAEDGGQEQEANTEDEVAGDEPAKVPSSGTKLKQAQSQAYGVRPHRLSVLMETSASRRMLAVWSLQQWSISADWTFLSTEQPATSLLPRRI